jgi:hypothetical protein
MQQPQFAAGQRKRRLDHVETGTQLLFHLLLAAMRDAGHMGCRRSFIAA